MRQKSIGVITQAEGTVKQLVDECRKHGPLYVQNPQIVAHVSRTGKWLLNAIAKLRDLLKTRKENE
jgi:hypothetical protein